MNKKIDVFAIAVIALLCFAMLCLGHYLGKKEVIQEAIKANAGRYVVDNEGHVGFEWVGGKIDNKV